MVVIKCEIIAKENDFGGYVIIVAKNLENSSFGQHYVMMTILPNWAGYIPTIGDKGFLSYNEVVAGVDKWYCPETGQMVPYNYTNIYFVKFIKEKDNSQNTDIIL